MKSFGARVRMIPLQQLTKSAMARANIYTRVDVVMLSTYTTMTSRFPGRPITDMRKVGRLGRNTSRAGSSSLLFELLRLKQADVLSILTLDQHVRTQVRTQVHTRPACVRRRFHGQCLAVNQPEVQQRDESQPS